MSELWNMPLLKEAKEWAKMTLMNEEYGVVGVGIGTGSEGPGISLYFNRETLDGIPDVPDRFNDVCFYFKYSGDIKPLKGDV